jgi:guanylate kinase
MDYPAHLFVLMGPSGVGKSTILRYMKDTHGVESAPKYTTRPSRNTEEDVQDFIFCTQDDFPTADILRFESYGHWFGIQLGEIGKSFERGRSHVTIVSDCRVANKLASVYANYMVTIFVFCSSPVLESRIFRDRSSDRAARWSQIRDEVARIYDELGCVEFVINNSGPLESTFHQIDRLLARLETARRS